MIIQIVGYKDSGKTTLMAHTIRLLKQHNLTVVTIKHHGHHGEEITLQHQEVDHMKHLHAGADQSIVQGHQYQQTITRQCNQSLKDAIDKSVTIDYDIILVEGYKLAEFDKIIVYRNEKDLTQLQALSNVRYSINLSDAQALTKFDSWLLDWIEIKG
ncbi:molybdopterin-guanine dinucleotide biosynthesis protein B [Staphylococcus lugdunensis]|nr:molybdopterin-guanine dinucleotide biosynthesis protein B [Staphylococcus lugdunensis]